MVRYIRNIHYLRWKRANFARPFGRAFFIRGKFMNNRIIAKFGGSSLSNGEQFKKVKDIVLSNPEIKVVVPSAPGKNQEEKHKVTDLLLMCHQLGSHKLNFEEVYNLVRNRYIEIKDELELDIDIEKELDLIHEEFNKGRDQSYFASRGEYLNGKLLANFLGFKFLDAKEVIRLSNGKPDMEKSMELINEKIGPEDYVVVPGFYGLNEKGKIETFSRGGSDITGSILAAGIHAKKYENWTDVSGFYIADPKIVEEGMPMETLTYKELRELSYMGAPVLHEEAIFPIKELEIPIQILNTNSPTDSGTLILPDEIAGESKSVITGIAGKKDFTVIRVEKVYMSEDLSFYRRMTSIFEANDINIEHMPTSIDTVSFVVPTVQIEGKEDKIKGEISIYCDPDEIVVTKGMAIIAIVGRGMVSAKGTSASIFSALAEGGVNIRMISQGSGEMNIIIVVENEDFNKAIKGIYGKFHREGKI